MTIQIHFCNSFDGVRLAYSQAGRGPAMLEVATWLNHLEHDWKSPVWGPRLAELTAHYTLTRYDGRGCGLSDRNVKDLTFDACLCDLESVIDAAGLKQFILLGCCQGTGLAMAYASRHPDRVSHLILYGAFARGRMKRNPSPQDIDEINTMLKLVETRLGPRQFRIPPSLYGAVHPGKQTGPISLVLRPATNIDFGRKRRRPDPRLRRHGCHRSDVRNPMSHACAACTRR